MTLMTLDDWLIRSAELPDDEERRNWLYDHKDQLSVELLETAKVRAESIGYRGDLEGALQIIAHAFPIAVVLQDLGGEAFLWRAWANVLQFHERYEDCLVISRVAVTLYEQLESPYDVAIARTVEVGALRDLERFDEAIALALWIRPYFEKKPNKLGLARLANALGRIYAAVWRLEEALPEYELARQLYLELGRSGDAAWALHNMGHRALRLDDLELAYRLLTQAYEEFIAVGDLISAVKAQFNLARTQLRQGQFEEALKHLAQARIHLGQIKEKNQADESNEALPDEGYVELHEASVRQNLHDPASAEKLLRKALALFEGLGRRLEAVEALVELARLLVATGNPERMAEGLGYLEEAVTHLANLPNSLFTAWVQLERGELFLRLGRIAEAEALAEQAANAFRAAGLKLRLAQALALLADCLWKRQPDEARRLYEEALALIGQGGMPLAVRCWRGLGRLALASGDAATAEAHYTQAVEILEALRRALRSHHQQAGFLEDKQAINEELLTAIQLQPGKEAHLLGWVERLKANVLADLLLFQPPDLSVDKGLRQLLEKRERVATLLDQHLSALRRSGAESMGTTIQRGPALAAHDAHQSEIIGNLRRQLRMIEEEINRKRDPTTAWRAAAAIQSEAVQRLLDEQTILVAYYTTLKGQLAAITVGHEPGDVQIHRLDVQLEAIWEDWRSSRNRKQLSNIARIRSPLALFYEQLIRPLERRFRNRRRLLILPHRQLFHFPFAALYDERTGSYLLERWMVQLAPSATILNWCQKEQTQSRAALLVGYPGEAGRPGFLDGVKEEIELLAKRLPGSQTLFGEEATEPNVLKHLPGNYVIHLAGHAYYDAQHPLESGMPLAADGWLRAADLYMRYGLVDGAMVVLSGCQTGTGKPTGGEVLGLISAFLYAGAHAVVSSLWYVDDWATVPLMREFYSGLMSGLETAEALRQAQLQMLNNEAYAAYAAPYFWAAFQLTGASRKFNFPDK